MNFKEFFIRRFLSLAALCLLVSGASGCAAFDVTAEPSIAFVGANVIPGDSERILESQTVLVVGDRIAKIGAVDEVGVPDNARKVESAGMYLMPGMAEMHGHIPSPDSPAEDIEGILFLFVANGVTTVRGMLGHENQLDLRDRANRGEILAPTLYLAGPSFSGRSIESPEQAAEQVRSQHAQGWDLLKVHPGLTRDQFDAMAQTAKELGMRFAGHVPTDVGLMHALEMGQETIDHLDGYLEYLDGDKGPLDTKQMSEVVERTLEQGAWVVPTMILWETILGAQPLDVLKSYEGLDFVSSEEIQNWESAHQRRIEAPEYDRERAVRIAENRKQLLKALHEGGVRILFGTDAPQQFSVPGFSIFREMEAMRESGMSPFEIIASGTRNVGEYFEGRDTFGLVAEGHRADLVLLRANPLETTEHIRQRAGVMVRGRWLPEEEIQERLEQVRVRK